MSQAALQQIEAGLAGAQAALLQGELAQMHAQLARTQWPPCLANSSTSS